MDPEHIDIGVNCARYGDVLDSVWTGANAQWSLSATITHQSGSTFSVIAGKWASPGKAWALYTGANTLKFIWYDSDTVYSLYTYGTLTASTEYNIEVTYDGTQPIGSRVVLKLDTVTQTPSHSQAGTPSTIQDTSAQTTVGATYVGDTPSNKYQGGIESVKIYDNLTLTGTPQIYYIMDAVGDGLGSSGTADVLGGGVLV